MTDNANPLFECQRCGGCCLRFPELTAFQEDIERWLEEDRDDILQYADIFVTGAADLWIHPERGEPLFRCPFLRKVRNKPLYRCLIYDTRPRQCRVFPDLQYNDDGELIAAHEWAVRNCPGVKKLLEGWPPERVQALREGKMMRKLPVGGVLDEETGEETEPRWTTCTWCGAEMSKGMEGYVLGAVATQRVVLEDQEGQFISLVLTSIDKTVQAFVAVDGSMAKEGSWDLTFITCSLKCARSLQAALRQETDLFRDVAY